MRNAITHVEVTLSKITDAAAACRPAAAYVCSAYNPEKVAQSKRDSCRNDRRHPS
jgi:hypothetical protein